MIYNFSAPLAFQQDRGGGSSYGGGGGGYSSSPRVETFREGQSVEFRSVGSARWQQGGIRRVNDRTARGVLYDIEDERGRDEVDGNWKYKGCQAHCMLQSSSFYLGSTATSPYLLGTERTIRAWCCFV